MKRRWQVRLVARVLWSTRLVDRVYSRFNQWRTRVALRLGSPALSVEYNDVAYGGQVRYRGGKGAFPDELFPFERRAVTSYFPPAPATVLIGGAGGGREALALAKVGYGVTAFEPAPLLVGAMRESARSTSIAPFSGRYETLPVVTDPASGQPVDLSTGPPFDAGMFGWASFSNLMSDSDRVEALRAMTALVNGPVLLSYFPHHADRPDANSRRGSFALHVGYFRDLTEEEVRSMVNAAGVDVVAMHHDTGWPFAVIERRRGATSG
jgi:hypothetical protein